MTLLLPPSVFFFFFAPGLMKCSILDPGVSGRLEKRRDLPTRSVLVVAGKVRLLASARGIVKVRNTEYLE